MKSTLQSLTDWTELERLLSLRESGKTRAIAEEDFGAALRNRVKGQDHIIRDLTRLIRLQWAKHSRKRPISNLLFLGPTGTGKTEMSKAIAEYLFGDENAMLRFDCSELSGNEAKNHLIGNPRGYSGDSEGGKLTRPMINNPKRLILFDEVEKAYPPVMDLFLQMMGDGRLTEQASGEAADFSQAIIVLTSNAEAEAISRLASEIEDCEELARAVKAHLSATGVFRSEILGRIDRIYTFKPLHGAVMAEIAVQKMVNAACEYGLELEYVDPRLVFEAMQKGNKLSRFGVRELERVVNDMLGDSFVHYREQGCRAVRLEIASTGRIGLKATALESLS